MMWFLKDDVLKIKNKKSKEQRERGRNERLGTVSIKLRKNFPERHLKCNPERAVYLELEMERITRRFAYYIRLSMDREICCANSYEPIALHEIQASPNDFVKLQFPILNTDQVISRCI